MGLARVRLGVVRMRARRRRGPGDGWISISVSVGASSVGTCYVGALMLVLWVGQDLSLSV